MTTKRRGEVRPVSQSELRRSLQHEQDDSDDRRGNERLPARLGVQLQLSIDELRSIYTENISAGGLMFSIAPPVSIPGSVDLTIELPDGNSVELSGEIRHVETQQQLCYVGVQFTGISDQVRVTLERALQRDRPRN